jgi:hypothetical protein
MLHLAAIVGVVTHHPVDRGRKFFWNVCQYLPDYTVQHPKREQSSDVINFSFTFKILLSKLIKFPAFIGAYGDADVYIYT